MTKVSMTRTGEQYKIKCSGHATGNSEACAAVSCLLSTLLIWLKYHADAGDITIDSGDLRSAEADIRWTGKEGGRSEAIFEFMHMAFAALHVTDPRAISEISLNASWG